MEGCIRGAEGSTVFCISHGGGARCQQQGCGRGARGKSSFCIAHGGGNRCRAPGCTKITLHGTSLYCSTHREGGDEGSAAPRYQSAPKEGLPTPTLTEVALQVADDAGSGDLSALNG